MQYQYDANTHILITHDYRIFYFKISHLGKKDEATKDISEEPFSPDDLCEAKRQAANSHAHIRDGQAQ